MSQIRRITVILEVEKQAGPNSDWEDFSALEVVEKLNVPDMGVFMVTKAILRDVEG